MKYYQKARRFVLQLSTYHVPLYAANASFYIILSLFPAIMLVVSLLPFIGYSGEDLLSAIAGLVPDFLSPLIERILNDMSTSSTGALLSAVSYTHLTLPTKA